MSNDILHFLHTLLVWLIRQTTVQLQMSQKYMHYAVEPYLFLGTKINILISVVSILSTCVH